MSCDHTLRTYILSYLCNVAAMSSGRGSGLGDLRSVNMDLSRHNSGELGLWEPDRSDSDERNLLSMAADFLGLDNFMEEEDDQGLDDLSELPEADE